MGDSSLNSAQAYLTLFLLPHLFLHWVCHPYSESWVHIQTSHWVQSQPVSGRLIGQYFPPNISSNGNYSLDFLRFHYIFYDFFYLFLFFILFFIFLFFIFFLRKRLNCDQPLSCKHYMDVLQNPPSDPLDTTWLLSHQNSLTRPFIYFPFFLFLNFSSSNSLVFAIKTRSST